MAYTGYSDSDLRNRFRNYYSIIESRDTISLFELSERSGVAYNTMLLDLQRMLQRGWFGEEAYISYQSKTLVVRIPQEGNGLTGEKNSDGSYRYSARTAAQTSQQGANTTRGTSGAAYSAGGYNTYNTAGQTASQRVNQSAYAGRSTSGQVYGTAQPSSKTVQPQTQTSAQTAGDGKDKKTEVRLYKKESGWLLGSALICGLITLSCLGNLFDGVAAGGFAAFAGNFMKTLIWGGLSAGSFYGRTLIGNLNRRASSYKKIQSGRDNIAISEFASAGGVTLKHARRDIEKMIDAGQWGNDAYIDAGSDMLRLKYVPVDTLNAAQPAAQPVQQPAQQQAAPQQAPVAGSEYNEILREIRRLDDEIEDENVSEKIRSIENITGKIFRVVEEKPEKKSEIKSFMSYYLPTTLKLLRSYSTFEKQGDTAGENVETAKKDIERILDTLVVGFSRQLDQLFGEDALDISTDIDVLETMMKKDGLSGEAGDFDGVLATSN